MKITLRQLKRLVKEEAARKMAADSMKEKAAYEEDMNEDDLGLKSPGTPMPPDDALMQESQRGNDENSQHDNDTSPGDPYVKKLKEAALRDLRLASAILRRSR